MTEPYALTLTEAGWLVRECRLSPIDLVEAALARIAQLDGPLQAGVAIDPQERAAQPLSLTARRAKGICVACFMAYRSGLRTSSIPPR
jgi:Asp-tRNA(Asn)/Glu-tRNA(Gln) amidotransferase A subunit family amidase